jgi:hypothetical protein
LPFCRSDATEIARACVETVPILVVTEDRARMVYLEQGGFMRVGVAGRMLASQLEQPDAVVWRVQAMVEGFESGGSMDVLVMLEDAPDHSPVLAHVNSVPSPLSSAERPSRDIVTIYGVPSAESLALALAAAVEGHRSSTAHVAAIRHLGVWAERGAIGDAAWRDAITGQLVTRDLEIPLDILHATASRLLQECGQLIGRIAAGLSMPDWPEGARRAITISLGPIVGLTAPVFAPFESLLDRVREADGLTFDFDGD